MEEKDIIKTCTGDCMKCSVQQRIYCSAQMTRNLIDAVNALSMRVAELTERVESINADDSDVFNPLRIENEETETQEAVV